MGKKEKSTKNLQQGTILPTLLVISGAFVIVIYGLLFGLTLQFSFSQRQLAFDRALHIAEAGVNYYRWHLAHAPADFIPEFEEYDYLDPEGSSIGKYNLEITAPSGGSSVVTIRSTGWSNDYPSIKRTVRAQYGIPSLAEYAFLSNSSTWYGSGAVLHGPIHSNNGIRMDGTNYSIVSSAQEEYMCGSETGCSPPERKPGVWGSGGDQGLWQFPVPAIDFDSISFDFATMKQNAQDSGLYLEPSNDEGYHIILLGDGTFRVYRVERTQSIRGYSVPGQGIGAEGQGGCRRLYQVIADEVLIDSFNISDTPIIFVEDYLWIEGEVNGRLTVAAASFPIVSSYVNIWITNNLNYAAYDGTNTLGLISQNNIFIAKDIPTDFRIDGIITAQSGKVIRHGYFNWCGGSSGAIKDKLTLNGSIISYFKSYWNYGVGPESGFLERDLNFDTNSSYNPPPYFPTSGEYEFISWTEE